MTNSVPSVPGLYIRRNRDSPLGALNVNLLLVTASGDASEASDCILDELAAYSGACLRAGWDYTVEFAQSGTAQSSNDG